MDASCTRRRLRCALSGPDSACIRNKTASRVCCRCGCMSLLPPLVPVPRTCGARVDTLARSSSATFSKMAKRHPFWPHPPDTRSMRLLCVPSTVTLSRDAGRLAPTRMHSRSTAPPSTRDSTALRLLSNEQRRRGRCDDATMRRCDDALSKKKIVFSLQL